MTDRIPFHLLWLIAALALCPGALVAQAPPTEPPLPEVSAGATAFELREKGLRALEDGILRAAQAYFTAYRDRVGTREPDFADATILLMRTSIRAGAPDQALAAAAAHAEQSDGPQDTFYLDSLQFWQARALYDQDRVAAALEKLTRLTAANASIGPLTQPGLELAGSACVKLGKFNRARGFFERLLAVSPDPEHAAKAKLGLVRLELAAGDPGAAWKILEQLGGEDSSLPSGACELYRLIILLETAGVDAAFAYWDEKAQARPTEPHAEWSAAMLQLAVQLTEVERYDDALAVLPVVRSTAADPNIAKRALLLTADCHVRSERLELAINTLESVRKEYPEAEELPAVRYRIAALLRRTKNPLAAGEYFGELVQDETVDAALRFRAAYERGWCFVDAEQHDQAVGAFRQASALAPQQADSAQALLLAGDAASRLGRFENAAATYAEVAQRFRGLPAAEPARFRQAESLADAEKYTQAADVFATFLAEYPESERLQEAALERALALKSGGEFARAGKAFTGFATQFPDSARTPQALLQAALAFYAAGNTDTAVETLTRIIDSKMNATHRAHALYRRARIRFLTPDNQAAIKDCWAFLEQFGSLPMAADVHFWLADHYANQGDLEQSAAYFLEIVTDHPDSDIAPQALYEAAANRLGLEKPDEARLLLNQLAQQYPNAPVELRAKAAHLYGDALCETAQYAEALDRFRAAADIAGDTPTGLAALGRAGEMYMAMSQAPDDTYIEKALAAFAQVAASPNALPSQRDMARYRKAKAYERLEREESALREYLDIVYQYDIEAAAGKRHDWFYFVRAGYDAARLLTTRADREGASAKGLYRQAARLYERLAATGLPLADEAARRAREIRTAHGLSD